MAAAAGRRDGRGADSGCVLARSGCGSRSWWLDAPTLPQHLYTPDLIPPPRPPTPPPPDHDFIFHARSISDAEEAQNAPTLVLLQNLLPAGPCLVVGILALEGQELAAHEPSAPALTVGFG